MKERSLSVRKGRPTKYTKETCRRVTSYIKKCQEEDEFPTIEQLARHLGVGTRTLYDWEKEYLDFSQTIDELRDTQRHLLISGGLNNKYNARFATFLLKASHGYSEDKPKIEATQNNYMNISPELLADALRLIRGKQ